MSVTEARCRNAIMAVICLGLLVAIDIVVTLSSGKSSVDRAVVIATAQHDILGRLDRIEEKQSQILRALKIEDGAK
jgi:hypothetical protein